MPTGDFASHFFPQAYSHGMAPTLILGCGYLGRRLAELLLEQGTPVLAVTHSPESAAALRQAGMDARALDISDRAALAALPRPAAIVHCAASGKGGGPDAYRRVYLDACQAVTSLFPGVPFLYTSSSSVYPQIDGSIIDEASPAEPPRENGRILRAAEQTVLEAGGVVCRLAGIYGPGRSVLLRQFLLGQSVIDIRTDPPPTPDGRWINQIHRDDAARAIVHLLRAFTPGEVYNVTDTTPLTQRQVYSELSRRFSLPLPPEAPPAHDRKRGWSHKRVTSSRLLAHGWSPRFPSWFDALDHDPDLLPSVLHQVEETRQTLLPASLPCGNAGSSTG